MLFCACLVCTALWAEGTQTALADKMLRLHVLANSDGPADQALKLQVRDRLLQVTQPLLQDCTNAQEVAQVLGSHLTDLSVAAQEVVQAEGYDYHVETRLEETWFPTRQYDGFALPAGRYQALRVVIGSGAGQNWWCVVFPPLCLSSVTETAAEAGGLTGGEVALITGEEEGYVFRFRTVELWEQLKHTIFS